MAVTPAKRMDDERESGPRQNLRVVAGGVSPARREEEALVAAFLVGDDDAFGELVRRNERFVLSLVRRYARTSEDARDLAQRTFLRAFVAARRALGHGPRRAIPFRRWLARVALNLSKNHLRDELRFARVRLEPVLGPADVQPVGADELVHARRAERMHYEVMRLPRRQREVLTLRIDAELPFAEIAETLGITENAAKVSFHHASRRLRDVLSREER